MLSENIKQMRNSKGLTQEELAIKLNVVRQTVSKWEKGLSVPDAEMLIEIADVFDIPVSALLGETVSPENEGVSVTELSNKLSLINEQLAKAEEKKRKVIKTLSLLGITGTVIYFIVQTLLILRPHFLSPASNSSVSVIGGADAPTSIFVASYGFDLTGMIAATVVLILSVVGLLFALKKK